MFLALLKNLNYLFKRPVLTWYKLTFWGILVFVFYLFGMYKSNGIGPLAIVSLLVLLGYGVILCGLKPYVWLNTYQSEEYEEIYDDEHRALLSEKAYKDYRVKHKAFMQRHETNQKRAKKRRDSVAFFFKHLW